MKWLWCWRCQREMPMLDEDEFASVDAKVDPTYPQVGNQWEGALKEYERITGFHTADVGLVYHHRLSLYVSPARSVVALCVHQRRGSVEVA